MPGEGNEFSGGGGRVSSLARVGGSQHRLVHVTARFSSSLEKALFQAIRAEQAGDALAPVVVLVGSNLLRNHLARGLAGQEGGHANVRFLTFVDLAHALGAAELGRGGLASLPAGGDLRLAARAAEGLPADAYYQAIAGRPGFHQALVATFTELRESGFDAEDFQGTLRNLKGRDGSGRLGELGRLFAAYRQALRQRHHDTADLFMAAAEQVAAGRFQAVYGVDKLLVYGFADLTGLQRLLLGALARTIHLHFFVPFDDSAAFRYAQPTMAWIESLGSVPQALEGAPDQGGPAAQALGDLSRLQLSLFQPLPAAPTPGGRGAAPAAPDGSVTIVSAPSQLAEVQEVARRVVGLAADGVPLHEVAVLYRGPEPYARLVRQVFEGAGIPYYQRGGPGLESTPAGRGLRLFLDLLTTDFPRQEVLEWLHAAPLDLARFGCPDIDPSRWDDITARARIVRGRRQWAERLVAHRRGLWRRAMRAREAITLDFLLGEDASIEDEGILAGAQEDQTLSVAESLERLLGVLFRAADAFPARAPWSAYAAAAQRFLEETLLPGAARDAVADAVAGLAALDAVEETVDLEGFRRAVGDELAQPRPVGRFQRGGVNLLDVMSGRGLSFRAVFLVGMVEKSFPAQARQDPLLLDAEREDLGGDGSGLALKRLRPQEEALLFTLAVQSARERLILTFPRAETAGGRERLPSPFLLRAAAALSGRPAGFGGLDRLPWLERVPGGALPPPGEAAALCDNDLVVGALAADPAARPAMERALPAFARGRQARSARQEDSLTPYDGLLGPMVHHHLARLHPADAPVAATGLEGYAACPFRYLLLEVLGIGPREEPEEELRITPLERGRLIHKILERLYRGLKEDGLLPLEPSRADEASRRLGAVREDACREWEERGLTGHPSLWQVDRDEIRTAMDLYLKRELAEGAGFVPQKVEKPFGMGPDREGDTAGAVVLELSNGVTVTVHGKVDRIDVTPDGSHVRVLDYKTRKLSHKDDDRLQGGEALQLPIYLLAAAGITGCQTACVEARYVAVNTAGDPWVVFRGPHLEADRDTFHQVMGTIVGGIRAGRFFPYPGDACKYCAVKVACSHGVEALWKRKAGDPAAADFLAMKGVR